KPPGSTLHPRTPCSRIPSAPFRPSPPASSPCSTANAAPGTDRITWPDPQQTGPPALLTQQRANVRDVAVVACYQPGHAVGHELALVQPDAIEGGGDVEGVTFDDHGH